MIPTQNGFELVRAKEIIRLQADSNYTIFFLADKRQLLVSRTLKEFDEMLSGHEFFRVHHSHLINLTYVKNYAKGEGGVVTMEDGTAIDVARRKKDDFIKALESV